MHCGQKKNKPGVAQCDSSFSFFEHNKLFPFALSKLFIFHHVSGIHLPSDIGRHRFFIGKS